MLRLMQIIRVIQNSGQDLDLFKALISDIESDAVEQECSTECLLEMLLWDDFGIEIEESQFQELHNYILENPRKIESAFNVSTLLAG